MDFKQKNVNMAKKFTAGFFVCYGTILSVNLAPVSYLDDDETYLKMVQEWKKDSENEYLRKYPLLGRNNWPVRHKKICRHQNN